MGWARLQSLWTPTKRFSGAFFVALLAVVAVILAIGFLMGQFFPVQRKANWDAIRPDGTPPPWVFGVVWGLLYAMVGVSMWFSATKPNASKGLRATIVAMFVALLGLLFAWSPAFENSTSAGLVTIVFATVASFSTTSFLSGSGFWEAALLAPLNVWLVYATNLNLESLRLEKKSQI